ncbi:MAG: Uma2 family endonuclease [Isosphaeraceae bacterium]|nr:Uma2 family endonuclease [Isosphaeraceae bacterium]
MSIMPLAPAEVEYPERDGKPMAESPLHRDTMVAVIDVLRQRFIDDPMMYVSGNMFVYYEQGNPRKSVAPDVFVARARNDPLRRVYKTWEEGDRGPELVVEVTSPSTREDDFDPKFVLYRDVLRVPEYFLFDPLEEYLDPPLQGFRLVGGQYVPIEPVAGRLPSEVLGLHFERSGWVLHLYDPSTGKTLLPSSEARAAAELARLEAERARIDAEIGRYEERAARQKAELARQQAELARQQAELAQQQEQTARAAAESENERLRLELEELRQRLGESGPL